jgi:hypothetical protein
MYKQSFYKFTAKFIAASLIVMLALTALPAPTASAATDTFETAGTFTWTAPAGVTSVTVSVWGGGGKGGSISGGSGETTGGGGGGGAYSTKTNIAVTPGTGYSVIVGAGSSSTAAGGDSYFIDASTVLAKGGNSVADNNNNGVSGGASASGVGTNKYSGGSGANGSGNGNRGGGEDPRQDQAQMEVTVTRQWAELHQLAVAMVVTPHRVHQETALLVSPRVGQAVVPIDLLVALHTTAAMERTVK